MKGNGDKLGVYFPIEGLDLTSAITAIGEALRLSLYRDHRFRSTAQYINFSEGIDIIGTSHSLSANLTKIWSTCSGVELSRQLVAAPAKIITPQALADTATNIARDFNLDIKILEREECQALGMGSYLAVGQGSSLPPKFIHITYTPKGLINRRVAIVGKGVTFDSGGYNLKVGASKIEMMKYDMGGSAAILGTARSIAELQPVGVEVHMIIAACENMISGSAIHPGDIVVASNGKTIEITNTDAEGRLTLADALVYACHLKPDSIVDIATLTGASVIALGEEIAGLWSTSDHLAAELVQAGEQGGELLWRMPLHYPYRKGMRSLMADMKNTASRAGSSITAALFLKEFISPGIEWAHIDMAGTVWSEKGRNQDPPGATGFGVRTLVNWICSSNQAD
eukprot:gb/GEZN01007074.1/.p1 GENE.gb/GEZN01007074.1/~~gb/GEZN01007074.1/.p1  ORF type:complete len:467 (+),score=-23.22 gb/GEZN01007074.1/:211-1401(+)